MQGYSENHIRALHSEFRSHKKYAGKLAFFERVFGIIPFSFPPFDPQVRYLFQKEKTELLVDIFKKERNNPGLTEKKFCFGETFVFNIRPANSNSSTYSNYILSVFLSRSPSFEEWIRNNKSADKTIEFYLDEANGIINQIEYLLQNEYDKSFMLQCMSVFYKGLYDAFRQRINLPDKKRKFIELYLYAQGIIYANYIRQLKTNLQESRSPVDSSEPLHLDLPGRLDLLNELGVIHFLKNKYTGLDAASLENKVAEILCLITGEYLGKKELIAKILLAQNEQSLNGYSKKPSSDASRKIADLTIKK